MDDIIKNAKRYAGVRYSVAICETALSLAFFVLLIKGGLSLRIKEAVETVSGNFYAVVILYAAAAGLALELMTFGLDVYGSFIIEHRFGLSRQKFFSWLSDYFKKSLISGLFYLASISVLYYFLKNTAGLWWLFASLAYLGVNVVVAKIFPVAIIPLFYKLTVIKESGLKERLLSLARRAGIRVLDVYNIALGEKTKKANAAVCGLGSTKRILLSDTLIESYSPDEIEATLAHELSHHKRNHFWKLIFVNIIFTVLGFIIIDKILAKAVASGAASALYDISLFPLFCLTYITFNIITLPVTNWISRCFESEADKEAVSLTKKPEVFAALIKKLSIQNLSDPDPNLFFKIFFYNHPPANERIAARRGIS